MNNRRLLFLLHLPPPVHGSSVVGLAIKESERINKAFDCSFINLLASQHVAESGKVSLRKMMDFVGTFAKLFGTLVSKRPQLCYLALTATGIGLYKDMLLVALLKVFRIKRVYHLHNKGVSLHQHKRINRMCYRFVFSGADVIILSKYLYPDIQEFVAEERMHVCANGIGDERGRKGEGEKGRRGEREKGREGEGGKETISNEQQTISNIQYPITNDQYPIDKNQQPIANILFLSNLIESKGVWVLLEACARLKSNKTAFKLVIIGGEGDITESQLNERIGQLGLSEVVSYRGKRYGEEKQQAFTEADIFAFPTWHETFGLVLLEAMSWSLPVVSTFEGGIPDVVEEGVTGFLVPQRDVAALADKLEVLIGNPKLRQQMGAAGRERYEREFTLERFERRMVEILEKGEREKTREGEEVRG